MVNDKDIGSTSKYLPSQSLSSLLKCLLNMLFSFVDAPRDEPLSAFYIAMSAPDFLKPAPGALSFAIAIFFFEGPEKLLLLNNLLFCCPDPGELLLLEDSIIQ